MKLKTAQLKDGLAVLSRVTGKRTTTPILNCVKIGCDGDVAVMQGSNGEAFITLRLPVVSPQWEQACIPFRQLNAVISSVAGEDVELLIKNQRLLCKSENSNIEIPGLNPNEFPPCTDLTAGAIGVNTVDLGNAIKSVLFAALADGNQTSSLKSIHVLADGKTITCEACDVKVAAQRKLSAIAAAFDIMVPAENAGMVAAFLIGPNATLLVSEGSATVKNDSGSITVRLSEGKYPPDVSRAFSTNRKVVGPINRAAIISPFSLCAENESQTFVAAKVTTSKDGMTIEYRHEHINLKTLAPASLEEISVHIDPKLVVRALREMDSETVDVAFAPNSNGGLVAIRDGDLEVLVATINPNGAKK